MGISKVLVLRVKNTRFHTVFVDLNVFFCNRLYFYRGANVDNSNIFNEDPIWDVLSNSIYIRKKIIKISNSDVINVLSINNTDFIFHTKIVKVTDFRLVYEIRVVIFDD